jgi:5-enolpyruvylshikimate-3-phosphate synthase
MEKLAPTLMVILSAASAGGYIIAGDVGRAVYWAAAALLTAAVTFWIKG